MADDTQTPASETPASEPAAAEPSAPAAQDSVAAEGKPAEAKPARRAITTIKVSEKGAVSVYGLGRFPVTLYREQWERLLAMSEEIRKFIEQNQEKLKIKEKA